MKLNKDAHGWESISTEKELPTYFKDFNHPTKEITMKRGDPSIIKDEMECNHRKHDENS
jgi:hypothetical protein